MCGCQTMDFVSSSLFFEKYFMVMLWRLDNPFR